MAVNILETDKARELCELAENSTLNIGDKWYLISHKWWLDFMVEIDNAGSSDFIELPPISNEQLLEKSGQRFKLKPKMMENFDFTPVPEFVFDELRSAFGVENESRDVIQRKVIKGTVLDNQIFIEYYPLEFEKTTDYTDFVIVAEDEFYAKSDVCVYNVLWEIEGGFDAKTQTNYVTAVQCKNIVPKQESCHAEVMFIQNNAIIHQTRKEFKIGERFCYGRATLVIIRILEPKEKFLKQLEERWTADVNFLVNGEKCTADRQYLASISPVFKKMLYGKFAEAKQNEIPFEGCESANVFKDFILAISPFRIQPNPTNVQALLLLAHQYDIPFLVRNCEEHLKHCYEFSIVDRLIMAGKYNLNGLKVRMGKILSNDELKKIWNEHAEKLCEAGVDYLTDIAINRL
ncbi:BTB/POZ domain-containing protein [Ditylenchus destructor]|nr:BTB/POZ domain-containing protein [Ditylenchus destructor]